MTAVAPQTAGLTPVGDVSKATDAMAPVGEASNPPINPNRKAYMFGSCPSTFQESMQGN